MTAHRRVATAIMLVGLATAGMMSGSTPALAYTNPLDCDSGPSSINCLLTNGGANEVWYINNVHYAPGDGQDSIFSRCQRDTQVGIYVEYTGGDGYGSAATSLYCGLVAQ